MTVQRGEAAESFGHSFLDFLTFLFLTTKSHSLLFLRQWFVHKTFENLNRLGTNNSQKNGSKKDTRWVFSPTDTSKLLGALIQYLPLHIPSHVSVTTCCFPPVSLGSLPKARPLSSSTPGSVLRDSEPKRSVTCQSPALAIAPCPPHCNLICRGASDASAHTLLAPYYYYFFKKNIKQNKTTTKAKQNPNKQSPSASYCPLTSRFFLSLRHQTK